MIGSTAGILPRVGAAGNPVLVELYEALWNRQLRIAVALRPAPNHAAADMAKHAAIAAALHEERPAEARELAADHLAASCIAPASAGDRACRRLLERTL